MDPNDKAASGSSGATPGSAQSDSKLELYKLEYERAAIRYEDIYKAVWQIFSYMTAISGALLAFGGDHFQKNFFWSLASAPLVFWFWGTYRPLDRYGTSCGERLSLIEEELNRTYEVQMEQYRIFDRRKKEKRFKLNRVSSVVWLVFTPLTAFFLIQALLAGAALCAGTSPLREKATEVKIVTVDTEELKKLIEGAKSISQTPTVLPKTPSAKTKSN
jgi:hypothetical protein